MNIDGMQFILMSIYDNVMTVVKTKHGNSGEGGGTSGINAEFIITCGCYGTTGMWP